MELGWPAQLTQLRRDLSTLLDDLVDADRGRLRPGVEHDAEDSRRVCQRLASAGLLVPHWPREWGGEDQSPWFQIVVAEEMWRRGEPRAPQYLNTNFIGPAIMRFGTDEQRRRFLPPIAAGTALWCQGFSETEAGSDLSRIRTTATKVDGGYRVRGSKLWISYADIAEHCFLLTKLVVDADDDAAVRRRERTVLLVSMSEPGISVREVPSLLGEHVFHEISFDDVFVADDAVLGDPERGWDIVKSALADERVGAPEYMQAERALDRALALLPQDGSPSAADDAAYAAVGEALVRCHGARLLTYAAVDDRIAGTADPRSAYRARAYGRVARQAAADGLTLLNADGWADVTREAEVEALNAIVAGIAGGAYEILLDLLTPEARGPVG